MNSILKYIASLKGIQSQSNIQANKDNRIFFLNSQNEGQGYTVFIEDINEVEDDTKALMQLKQKAAIMKECNHQNILNYKEDLIFQDKFIILMEKCNQSLKRYVQEKFQLIGISLQVFIDLALQLLNAVDYLHSKNLYLQNFNNKNILLDENINIKLHDFGERQVINTLKAYKQFQLGENQQTFHYFAPEQLDSTLEKEVQQTVEADIWSVGISLYVLAGADFEHVYLLTRGLKEYQHKMQINDEINLLLSQMLSQDPNKRPQLSHIKEQFEIIKKNVNSVEQISINKDQNELELQKFIKAQVLYENDLNKQSYELLEELIQQNQEYDMYYAWKARNLAIFEKFQESHESADKALSINPQNYIALNVKGYIYSVENQKQKSEEYFKASINVNPKFLTAVQNLGNDFEDENRIEEAIEMYEKSNLLCPNNIQILNNLGRLYLNQNKYEEAKKYLEQIIKIYPNNFFSLYNLGVLSKLNKSSNKSLSYFQKIAKNQLLEGLSPVLNQIGNIYFEKKEYQQCLEKYQRCKKLDPEEDAYRYNIRLIKKLI
ncbi:hypothetical protein ABPG74_003241 [Tetrahymena malaccensis]